MSHEGHFGLAGAYREDPGAAAQREHREREKQLDREERCARWLATRMVGQTYESREALTVAAVNVVETLYGRELTEDERTTVTRACRDLFHGLVNPRYFAGRILVTRGERIRFLKAS